MIPLIIGLVLIGSFLYGAVAQTIFKYIKGRYEKNYQAKLAAYNRESDKIKSLRNELEHIRSDQELSYPEYVKLCYKYDSLSLWRSLPTNDFRNDKVSWGYACAFFPIVMPFIVIALIGKKVVYLGLNPVAWSGKVSTLLSDTLLGLRRLEKQKKLQEQIEQRDQKIISLERELGIGEVV